MAKHDWEALQTAFLADNADTGITAQQWCEQHGLNYQSARRYIKPRAAQSAQKKPRRTAHNAQSDTTAQQCANSDDVQQEEQKLSTGVDDDRDPESEPDEKPNSGRSGNGQFTKGNRHSEGNAGNPNPVGAFTPGNQAARKHGAYARYLNADDLFEAAADSDLHDELIFTRARALSVTKTMRKIHEDLAAAESVEARIELYDKLLKAESALDRNIGRIESIENSLSKLKLDAINGPRLKADTYRIKAATSKLEAETQKLTSEGKGVTTPLSEAVKEVRDSGQDGLL
ncbi:TPA: terminase [Yersinia enterocolitica]|uniref:terminase n=1 Tax=Yersinia enterocolitica TaxID=630 RepID=UPI0028B38868|nr:terminase [Yersinia enterocolitica]EKN4020538.1 terminase [Yersinia enterocolitica]EKN6360173.1 terminase [Yersinia enterocolitica]EKN6405619.1 terminase [Yersinia enterocolitica]ELI7924249.1 terminase [Yersinia enterocolitica]